jgi:FKBP-type peptidyl-prolyl cis-trans isomerases 1
MTIKTLPAVVLALGLALTGCTADVQASSQPSASVSASVDNATDAPEVDRDPQGELPAITFSSKGIPTMAKITSAAPAVISVKTLTAGDGAAVASGDYVKVNYAGFLWSDGTQFDSSYDSGEPASFALNQVVDGWKYGLVGAKVGDRLELVVPSDYGYGDQEQDSIPAGSTLVFVVDVLASTSVTTEALTSATITQATLPTGITVTGELGQEPTLTIAADAAKPTENQTIVLAEGKGATITETDTLLYHIVACEWGGESSSSWDSSYQQTSSGGGEITVGKRVGSRLLLVYPADETNGTAAQAYVIDVLAAIPAE